MEMTGEIGEDGAAIVRFSPMSTRSNLGGIYGYSRKRKLGDEILKIPPIP